MLTKPMILNVNLYELKYYLIDLIKQLPFIFYVGTMSVIATGRCLGWHVVKEPV